MHGVHEAAGSSPVTPTLRLRWPFRAELRSRSATVTVDPKKNVGMLHCNIPTFFLGLKYFLRRNRVFFHRSDARGADFDLLSVEFSGLQIDIIFCQSFLVGMGARRGFSRSSSANIT